MQTPRRPDDRAAAMIRKRSLAAAAAVLWLAPMLGSCGGFVADHWPHWAGGLPPDAPPRPGAPGYEEFIAHGEAPPAPSAAAAAAGAAAAVAETQAGSVPTEKAGGGKVHVGRVQSVPPQQTIQQENVQPEAVTAAPPDDASVTRGGLY